MKSKILIVDDDIELCQEISQFLESDKYEVKTAHLLREAEERYAEFQPDIVLLDLKFPDGSGLELLKKIKNEYPEPIVVMLSAYGTISTAVKAIKLGAENFLTKPVDPDYLLIMLEKLAEQKHLRNRLVIQDLELADRRKMIIGKSKKMQEVLQTGQKAALRDVTILITGETGTGKHLLAHYLHQNSPRSQFTFVYVNCTTLTETLLESDLFGHEKGAFTGALKLKQGRVELANRGTLFLDEIGEISLSLQAKLLHFTEYGEFQRVGGTNTLRSDTRIICATNRQLESEVEAGKFREDLYYRINVIQLNIPPLRERPEDIPILLNYFLEKYSREMGRAECKIVDSDLEKICNYTWPGNIRELQNAVERAVVLCKSKRLTVKDFPFLRSPAPSIRDELFQPQPLQQALNQFKKKFISELLMQSGGNQTQTAKILNIQRTYLSRLIKELSIKEY